MIIKKIFTNLAFQVLLAIIAGILLGHFFPATAVEMEVIGKTFISIIKVFIAPIIFLTIVLGISSIGNLKKVGRVGVKALIYFEVVTTLALAIGILVAWFLKPGNIDRGKLGVMDANKYTNQTAKSFDWGEFFLNNLTLQVLIAAIICGIILSYSKHREAAVSFLGKVSKIVFTALRYVVIWRRWVHLVEWHML